MATPVFLQQILAALQESVQLLRLTGNHCSMGVAGGQTSSMHGVQVLKGRVLVCVEHAGHIMDHTVVLEL